MQHFSGPRGGDDPLGSAMNSQAHRINIAMMAVPQTVQQVAVRSGIPNEARVRQHMRWLVENGFADKDGERWSLNGRGLSLLEGHLLVKPAPTAAATPVPPPGAVAELPESYAEGRRLLRLHRLLERSRPLIARKKREVLESLGKLDCEACGFDFAKVYGARGEGFAECHHTLPVSQSVPGRRTRPSELAVVCANCHRMLHRRPWLSVPTLRELLQLRRDG